MVDGEGRVAGHREGGTCQAPASGPTPNKATIAVTSEMGTEQTILFSTIRIVNGVKTCVDWFSLHDVTVNSEYTSDLAGQIRWDFEEECEIGGWREFYSRYTVVRDLTFARNGSCSDNVIHRFQVGWSFKALD